MTRQKKNLKTVSVHSEYTDLILKMIKKAKISRVRVPLIHKIIQKLIFSERVQSLILNRGDLYKMFQSELVHIQV
jgi:hypothetical protein